MLPDSFPIPSLCQVKADSRMEIGATIGTTHRFSSEKKQTTTDWKADNRGVFFFRFHFEGQFVFFRVFVCRDGAARSERSGDDSSPITDSLSTSQINEKISQI